jgi:hypothetical protein
MFLRHAGLPNPNPTAPAFQLFPTTQNCSQPSGVIRREVVLRRRALLVEKLADPGRDNPRRARRQNFMHLKVRRASPVDDAAFDPNYYGMCAILGGQLR